MTISEEGKSLIKKFEGCELTAYKCAAGVPTIGYGHIKGVSMGDTITQEEADEMFNHEMKEYETYVNTAVTVPLSQNQFDAIVSWVFNLGNGNLKASTMLKVIKLWRPCWSTCSNQKVEQSRWKSFRWLSAKKRSRSVIISGSNLGTCLSKSF